MIWNMKNPDTLLNSERLRCLLVFAYQSRWEHHLVRKLSLKFDVVSILYAAASLQTMGYSIFLKHLSSIIKDKQIQFVFFCVDFYPAIDVNFIRKLPDEVKKILLTFDDIVIHEVNSINASACDLVLSGDPVSILKYQEKGMNAEFITLETSSSIYKAMEIEKDIDVLFFGAPEKADRKVYLDYLRNNGINITVVGDNKNSFLTPEKLGEHIARAKIVLNFSKTMNLQGEDLFFSKTYADWLNIFNPFSCYMQLKGRILEAGLCKTVCISEDAPGIRLLFTEDEVPVFKTTEECFSILTDLLSDSLKRETIAARLYKKTSENYEDSVQMNKIALLFKYLKKRNADPIVIPCWYYKLCLKARFESMLLLYKKPDILLREILLILSDSVREYRLGLFLLAIPIVFHMFFVLVKKICGKIKSFF